MSLLHFASACVGRRKLQIRRLIFPESCETRKLGFRTRRGAAPFRFRLRGAAKAPNPQAFLIAGEWVRDGHSGRRTTGERRGTSEKEGRTKEH